MGEMWPGFISPSRIVALVARRPLRSEGWSHATHASRAMQTLLLAGATSRISRDAICCHNFSAGAYAGFPEDCLSRFPFGTLGDRSKSAFNLNWHTLSRGLPAGVFSSAQPMQALGIARSAIRLAPTKKPGKLMAGQALGRATVE